MRRATTTCRSCGMVGFLDYDEDAYSLAANPWAWLAVADHVLERMEIEHKRGVHRETPVVRECRGPFERKDFPMVRPSSWIPPNVEIMS